jgi:hypothetical protein
MTRNLLLIITITLSFSMMTTYSFGQNSSSIPQPYVINSLDHDSLLLLKKQVNGGIKKLELAKKEMKIVDSVKYNAYEKRMLNKISNLINEIETYEDR